MTSSPLKAAPSLDSDSSALSELSQETFALTRRLFIQLARRPSTLVAGGLQPLIWLTLFGALFAKAPEGLLPGGISYGRFLGAGVIVFTAFSGALNAGLPVMFDREFGFLNRLLVAPLRSRSSIVLASVLYITVISLLQSLAIMATAAALGYGWPGGAGLLLVLVTLLLLVFAVTALSLGPAMQTPVQDSGPHRTDRSHLCGQSSVAVCQHGIGPSGFHAQLDGMAGVAQPSDLRD